MLGSRQPSALGRGGRAAPAPDVSRGTPARRWGQGAALTKQARDRTRYLLALALQPGRLLHAARTAPRERGQLKGESQRGGRLALGQASAIYRFFNTSMGRACLARARRRGPGIMQSSCECVCFGSHAPPLSIVPRHPAQNAQERCCFHASNTSTLGAVDCGGWLAGCPRRAPGAGGVRGAGARWRAGGVSLAGRGGGWGSGHELERRRKTNHETREKVARQRESRAESPETPRAAHS